MLTMSHCSFQKQLLRDENCNKDFNRCDKKLKFLSVHSLTLLSLHALALSNYVRQEKIAKVSISFLCSVFIVYSKL